MSNPKSIDPRKKPESIALELLGGCTCSFEKGFAWDGIHKDDCILKRVAKVIQAERDDADAILKEVHRQFSREMIEYSGALDGRNGYIKKLRKEIESLKSCLKTAHDTLELNGIKFTASTTIRINN